MKKNSKLKSKFWITIFFLCFLICIIFSIDALHFAIAKKKTHANIESVEKTQSNKYRLSLNYSNGENIVHINKIVKKGFFEKIDGNKRIEIFYRNIFPNEIYLVKNSPNFLGQAVILLIASGLFFIGFYTSKENLKDNQL